MSKAKTKAPVENDTIMDNYYERPESNLVTLKIDKISDAHRIFGERTRQGYTPLVLVPKPRTVTDCLMIIPHGFDSIVVENGSTLGVFRPGLYFRSQFFQVSYLVSKQRIPYHFGVKSCPTKDNVRVDVYIDFLFHVADSMKFITQISAENMEELLRATEAESVRSLVRTVNADRALDLRGMNSDDMLMTLNDKLGPYGICIDQVTVASVYLPFDVTMRLQNTTTFESKQLLQNKVQQLEMLKLDNSQVLKSKVQEKENEKRRAKELSNKSRMLVQQEINKMHANNKAECDKINDDLFNQIAKIKADCSVEVGKIYAERDKKVATIMEEGKAKVNEIDIETKKYNAQKQAEIRLKVAENQAKILQIKLETEKYVGSKIKTERDNVISQRRLGILRALSKNPDTVICGMGQENVVSGLLATTLVSERLGIGKIKK